MPPGPETKPDIARLERLADRLDTAFRVPGTRIRFGWDALLGLIPGIGDVATLVPAAWILLEARRLGAPPALLARMGLNVGVDALAGMVPLLGDLLDLGFKANRRNVALLRAHLENEGQARGAEGPARGDGLPRKG